jgi:glutamate N-acetyltransferase/amino-acid N-acetyltransferase
VTAGFTTRDVQGTSVILNEGPRDDAAGVFADTEAPDALWTRQVLTTGRLRAVAVVPAPEDFVAVHRVAERVAAELGLGAIQVGVVAHPDEIVLTDAALDAAALTEALEAVPVERLKIMLASGAAA